MDAHNVQSTEVEVIDDTTAYQRFVAWLSLPPHKRKPRYMDEFCQQNGITKEKLVEFQDADGFYDHVYQSAVKWGQSKLPEILHILYEKIKKEQNAQDIRTFKELLQETKSEDHGKNVQNNYYLSVNDDQYKQIIKREAQSIGFSDTGSEKETS